jgi:DNA-directed RNA polymerase subunit RPC12/RpoP
MFFHCIACHQPFKTIYRCVHCSNSSQIFTTLSDQQQQQQTPSSEKHTQSNFTYLCTNCERKSFFYHFWDHSFVRVWNWNCSEEELTKLIESKKLTRSFKYFLNPLLLLHFRLIGNVCELLLLLQNFTQQQLNVHQRFALDAKLQLFIHIIKTFFKMMSIFVGVALSTAKFFIQKPMSG